MDVLKRVKTDTVDKDSIILASLFRAKNDIVLNFKPFKLIQLILQLNVTFL